MCIKVHLHDQDKTAMCPVKASWSLPVSFLQALNSRSDAKPTAIKRTYFILSSYISVDSLVT